MDYEMAELSEEMISVEDFDIDYEFDAPRFYDFSRPESDSDEIEAGVWFKSARDYPPAPFRIQFNWRCDILKKCVRACSESKVYENMNPVDVDPKSETTAPDDKFNGFIYYNQPLKDMPKATPNSQKKPSLSRSSTLTKPTACVLARLNKPLDAYSVQLLRRCQRSIGKSDDKISTLLSSVIQSQDNKRQRLEAGYLRKVGRVNSINGRSKVTIPKEPELKTAKRAERHRSKVNPESIEHAKLNSSRSKPRNNMSAFHLRTFQRATQHVLQMKNAAADDSVSEIDPKQSKTLKSKKPCIPESNVCHLDQKMPAKVELYNIKSIKEETTLKTKVKVPTDSGFQEEPLIESFNMLSMASDSHAAVKCQSVLHIPDKTVNMDFKRSESFNGRHSQCGNDRKPVLLDVNRSLDIC